MAITDCVIRGNGRAYAMVSFNQANIDFNDIALYVEIQNGDRISGEVKVFSWNQGIIKLILIFPIIDKPIRLLLCKKSDKSSVYFQKKYTPFWLKWESRLNYRLKSSIARQIRDIDDNVSSNGLAIKIDKIVPEDEQCIVRFVVSALCNQEKDLEISFYDSNFKHLRVNLLLMGKSSSPIKANPSTCMSDSTYSFCLTKDMCPCIIEAHDEKYNNSSFVCIDSSVLQIYSDRYNELIQNAQSCDFYEEWLGMHKADAGSLLMQRFTSFKYEPLISIVSPIFNTPINYLLEMVNSVCMQTYSNWELVLVNASSNNAKLSEALRKIADKDGRIRIIELGCNSGITLNTKAGIDASDGEYISFLDHDDFLEPNALYEYVAALNDDPSIDIIYCDEDKIIDDRRCDPHFKPDFSLFLLREINYICHFLMIRRSLFEYVKFDDPTFDGAQDHDLILQCVEKTSNIRHIPKILYTWRVSESSTASGVDAKPYADIAGRLAVENHLSRCGIDAFVERTCDKCRFHVRYRVNESPMVSILIPNKDSGTILQKCVCSILDRTNYYNYEIIIIENNSISDETFEIYDKLKQKDSRISVVVWSEGSFNYSAINNYGAKYASGNYLLFLNNDTEMIKPDWLETMLGICQQPNVGIVGAKLLYPDMLIQHAGVYVQGDGAGHLALNLSRHERGYFNTVKMTRELSAVTAACMMIDKQVFEEVGGFDPEYAVAFNDIDLCMKVRAIGKLVIYSPLVELLHYESVSRGYENTFEKIMRFNREASLLRYKWSDQYVTGDPYMNVNLVQDSGYYKLRKN